LSVVSVVR